MLLANNGPRVIHETQLSALPHWVCVTHIQYIPRNMHTVFALLCFIVVIHWLIFPYPPGLLHWHCGNLTIAPVPAKQPWWIWINTSCEFIMNDCITTTKQSTTKPCAYFLGYIVWWLGACRSPCHYLNHCWSIINLRPVSFIQNLKHFVKENAFENVVCKMAVILS